MSQDESDPVWLSTERPYHAKRPHRKSRTGCVNCKTRKVKCDEARPSCRACTMRREDCKYPTRPSTTSSSPMPSTSRKAFPVQREDRETSVPEYDPDRDRASVLLLKEPLFSPADTDSTDMKLLWFYTAKTYDSFNTNGGRVSSIDDLLKITIVRYAFQRPFLMSAVLGITGLHMKHLNVPVPEPRVLAYRANAFEGYRKAIEEAKPETFPGLLASSLLLCALSSAHFREEEAKPLYILDWILVWRGIGLIIDLVKPEVLFRSGMAALFFRPPIDLNTSALHIPSNLLFMVTSVKDGDEDFRHVPVYYDTLKYLGALYKELLSGFGPILDLRVITFFTFLPVGFIDLARGRRPRALVIIAHYLAFARTVTEPWWMRGIADREIDNVCNVLGPEDENLNPTWAPLVRVPRAASRLSDPAEIAKLLLDNHTWEPPSRSYRDKSEDQRAKEITWVDDTGKEIDFDGVGGDFVYRGGAPTVQKPKFNVYAMPAASPNRWDASKGVAMDQCSEAAMLEAIAAAEIEASMGLSSSSGPSPRSSSSESP